MKLLATIFIVIPFCLFVALIYATGAKECGRVLKEGFKNLLP